jgi:hypothetical protein
MRPVDEWEFVFSVDVGSCSLPDRLWYAWDDAQEEADIAYAAWCSSGEREAFFVYRAAQDRADAAAEALAEHSRARCLTAPSPPVSPGVADGQA